MPDDDYTCYVRGLRQLQERLDQNSPFAADAGTLAFRLNENIHAARLYGDDENRRSSRAAILHQLERLTHDALGTDFAALYEGTSETVSGATHVAPAPTTPTNRIGSITGDHNIVMQGDTITINGGILSRFPSDPSDPQK